MKFSTERILTTRAGALPQPPDLKAMHVARMSGQPVDETAFAKRVRDGVAEVVNKQIACGLDIINDGEVGKSNFSRYARERLSGFIERDVRRLLVAGLYHNAVMERGEVGDLSRQPAALTVAVRR